MKKLKTILDEITYKYGSCIPMVLKEIQKLQKTKMKYSVYEGFVEVNIKVGVDWEIIDHTWIKTKAGKIIDPTKSQFKKYGGIRKYLDETNTSKHSGEYPTIESPDIYLKHCKLTPVGYTK